ncbi:hypothetical protein [Agitococcus lubricus]|uniref:ArsR family transcriptional regulator n=1 Tax=Agitococcus lubricus TaxID=1077255 RepID=A0A2T5J3R5_9GAMM|nr:hypothetical protein [Agitococcus lubricus]PTQ91259.1 hypothetical protein C8N29_101332 [Agitococcus lubricus]
MSFTEFVREEQRLVLLRLLHEMPRYQSNSSVLTTGMDKFGLAMSRDQVCTELNWLKEQGCVTLQEAGSVVVATLTERGADAATGMTKIHGVKRPSPR